MWYAIIISFVILIFLFACLQIAFSIVTPKTRTLEATKRLEIEKDKTLFEFYHSTLTKEDYLKSRYGYSLKLYYFLNAEYKKYIVIAHGHTYTHHGCIKYARMMYKYGYNVITYDQRYHGDSGGKNTSLGYYEKNDLYDIISKITQEFGEDIFIGTYGESMGAATILLEQELDRRVKFCISDCAFSDLKLLIQEQIKSYHLPKFIYVFVDLFVKVITGINLKEVSPISSIKNSTIPILFIHGEQDKFIKYHHTVDMYESYGGKKALFIAKNQATHAYSYFSDTLEYENIVQKFIEENIDDKI